MLIQKLVSIDIYKLVFKGALQVLLVPKNQNISILQAAV